MKEITKLQKRIADLESANDYLHNLRSVFVIKELAGIVGGNVKSVISYIISTDEKVSKNIYEVLIIMREPQGANMRYTDECLDTLYEKVKTDGWFNSNSLKRKLVVEESDGDFL